MELEYSDKNSRRSKVYIGVGVIVALLVGGDRLRRPPGERPDRDGDVEMRAVVVAVRDIPARKAIEEGDVAVRSVVADPTNETAFTSARRGARARRRHPGLDRAARDPQRARLDDRGPDVLDPRSRRGVRPERARTGARSASPWSTRTRWPARSCRARSWT